MAEEETYTIRKLMRLGGYLIRIPAEPAEPAKPEVKHEGEGAEPTPEPAPGPSVELPTPTAPDEEVKKRLDALVVKMVKALREQHGDVMLLSDFVASLIDEYEREYGSLVEVEDVLSSVADLTRKGLIAGITTLDSGARIIRLSPEEFGVDELKVLDIVSKKGAPDITLEELMEETGWPPARARAALEALERMRVARHVPGSFTGEQDKWYFPGLEKKA